MQVLDFSKLDERDVNRRLNSFQYYKLENDMLLLGKKIKQHEDNIKYLRTHKNSLDDVITDMQVTLGKYHERHAAAIVCRLKRHLNQATRIKDVLGFVATLGKVKDDNLSSLQEGNSRAGYKRAVCSQESNNRDQSTRENYLRHCYADKRVMEAGPSN